MAIELLAIGTQPARSSDVVIASGSSATIFLKATGGGAIPTGAVVQVQMKDDAGAYNFIGQTLTGGSPACSLMSPGTYAFFRTGTGDNYGVEQG